MSHHHNHSSNRNILFIAFLLTITFTIVEIVFGFLTNSLALLSEGFHMLSDSFSLFLGFIAVIIGAKKSTQQKTFGFRRVETIAAFLNGLALLIIPIFVVVEAINRFLEPHNVLGPDMLKIAILGLVINTIVAFILSLGDREENLNLKAAFLHVFADLTSSVGVIVASLIIIHFGYVFVDPLVSIIVSIVIFIGGIKVTKESFNVLMEGVPKNMDYDKIKSSLLEIDGVLDVSKLKIWSIASCEDYLNVHLVINEDSCELEVLKHAQIVASSFELFETIQIDKKTS